MLFPDNLILLNISMIAIDIQMHLNLTLKVIEGHKGSPNYVWLLGFFYKNENQTFVIVEKNYSKVNTRLKIIQSL